MADSKSTLTPLDFMEMRNVLVLAAFAAEARRVLDRIELVEQMYPELGQKLSLLIDARRQWASYEDTAPDVINAVAERLEAMYKEQ